MQTFTESHLYLGPHSCQQMAIFSVSLLSCLTWGDRPSMSLKGSGTWNVRCLFCRKDKHKTSPTCLPSTETTAASFIYSKPTIKLDPQASQLYRLEMPASVCGPHPLPPSFVTTCCPSLHPVNPAPSSSHLTCPLPSVENTSMPPQHLKKKMYLQMVW